MNSSVSIASWNVNNRVGRVLFKPDAALAAIALETDIVVLNEFYPGTSEAVFRQRLADGGLQYQVMSMDTGARANRVLIASREPIGPLRLDLPRFDDQFAANIAAVRVLRADLVIMGLRVPTYSGATAHQLKASWEWIEQAGRFLATHAGVIVGDLNTSTGRARFQPLLDGGWMRVQPEAGPSWFGTGGKSSEIDHVLHTGTCRVDSARFVRRAGGFDLVGSSDALSDHAALCFSASTTDSASVVRDRS